MCEMISKTEALSLAKEFITGKECELDCKLVIQDEKTIERSFGWVFFYNSKEFVETKDPKYMIAGNAPLIVNRSDSVIQELGTAHPIEYYVDEYESASRS